MFKMVLARIFCLWIIFSAISLVLCIANNSKKGSQALDNFPVIDGHNDFPHNLFLLRKNKINDFNIDQDLSNDTVFGYRACNVCHTDFVRLKKGKVGGLFWVAYVDCEKYPTDAVIRTMDQIDVIKRLINRYPETLQYVTTAEGIAEAFRQRKIASMIAVEGGHSIDSRLSILRLYYELGVRYLTLTHICNLPWADGSPVDQNNTAKRNLTAFGEKIVLEMNRLGMLVDLSHVSYGVMARAIEVSRAPVIFSHSSAFSVHNHHRNVRNEILLKLKETDGIIMVNFYSDFIGSQNSTIHDVATHINYITDLIGFEHIGIGADYDGVNIVPRELKDVSKYPDLFDLLHEMDPHKWTLENLEKLAGRNFVRVFTKVEQLHIPIGLEEANLYQRPHGLNRGVVMVLWGSHLLNPLGSLGRSYVSYPPISHIYNFYDAQASCIICRESPLTHAFIPCGHMCVCGVCGPRIMNETGQCVLCRNDSLCLTRIYS